jgi:FkbM family methyltransferase
MEATTAVSSKTLIDMYRQFDLAQFKHAIQDMPDQQRHYLTERATLLIYCKVVQAGDCVFDIGANHGEHTRTLKELVGERGVVHAFEPNPSLVGALRAIGPNVHVHDVAVSDVDGVSSLKVPRGRDSWGSLHDRSDVLPDIEMDEFEVQVKVIDNFSPVQNTAPTFVKIDVEGFEFQTVSGMKRLLAKARPLMTIENPTRELVQLLEQWEYRVFDFFGGSDFPVYDGIYNALAVPYGYPNYEALFLNERDFAFMFLDYAGLSKLKD